MSTYQNKRKYVVKRFWLQLQTVSLVQMGGKLEPYVFGEPPFFL